MNGTKRIQLTKFFLSIEKKKKKRAENQSQYLPKALQQHSNH